MFYCAWLVILKVIVTVDVITPCRFFKCYICLLFPFLALSCPAIGTIGIGDGGNEIGMGKVRDLVRKHIPHGEEIACCVGADQLITAGVSNWGGYALATALHILHNCPIHSRYLRRGIGKHQPLGVDRFVNSSHQVQAPYRLMRQGIEYNNKNG